jgi:hypothetical protein
MGRWGDDGMDDDTIQGVIGEVYLDFLVGEKEGNKEKNTKKSTIDCLGG